MKTKKFNSQTKGYKIDIFADGRYVGSTDMQKTCKAAKARYLETHTIFCKDKKIKCFFDYK